MIASTDLSSVMADIQGTLFQEVSLFDLWNEDSFNSSLVKEKELRPSQVIQPLVAGVLSGTGTRGRGDSGDWQVQSGGVETSQTKQSSKAVGTVECMIEGMHHPSCKDEFTTGTIHSARPALADRVHTGHTGQGSRDAPEDPLHIWTIAVEKNH